jgi:site-specific DNA-methyltransferase (adenine-specific)/modification methylase|tara:strand:- start:575 stop:1261 length:687 start_codon:yes stop_codon:yes gene_type:complete
VIKEIIGDATLYLGDCKDILPGLGQVDAVVTDPPYGIGAHKKRGDTGKNKHIKQRDYYFGEWDGAKVSQNLINSLLAQSDHQIIFGGNYYQLPQTRCWFIWDKMNGQNNYADFEMVWSNLNKSCRKISWLWHGMLRNGAEQRWHPTQKPLGVMQWCINHLPDDDQTILDPFMGSGTTGVAALNLGRKFIGIEKEAEYFEIACRRISDAERQDDLFIQKRKPEQLMMVQ